MNAADLDGMRDLMHEDHRLVDPLGASVQGRARVLAAWSEYLRLFRGYQIAVERSLASADMVALFGRTTATYVPTGRLVEMHAAWLATVRDGRITEWRVYADNEPARAAMRERQP